MRALLASAALLALAACDDTPVEPARTPIFSEGQIVRMVAFGHVGMVTNTYCQEGFRVYDWSRPLPAAPCLYYVRFATPEQKTQTSWLGDGPIRQAPFAVVRVQEFEIEPYTPEDNR